jgi:hypothetical protein
MNCPTCNRPMTDIGDIGSTVPQWVCNHPDCLSHHQGAACPNCSSPPRFVHSLANGQFEFSCVNGHIWDTLPRLSGAKKQL